MADPEPVADAADRYDLERFVAAQQHVYAHALAELSAGRKRSHWMWFVLPQIDGLGSSPLSKRYAIHGIAEAKAYVHHRLLGARLIECFQALLAIEGRSARAVMGSPDDVKLKSCATLFERAAPQRPEFGQVLDRYFGGERDAATLRLLAAGSP